MNGFYFYLDKTTLVKFQHVIAFNKATNGGAVIQQENYENFRTSLNVGESLPSSWRSSLDICHHDSFLFRSVIKLSSFCYIHMAVCLSLC